MDLGRSDIWQIFKVVDILIVLHKIKDFDKPDFVMYSQFIERNGKDDITIRYIRFTNLCALGKIYQFIENYFRWLKMSQKNPRA